MGRFVGRVTEFAGLVALLDVAGRGSTAFALVSGEAGMGKSRLLAEFGRFAEGRGWTVRRGRASDEDGAPSFWLWHQVLESLDFGGAPASAEQRFAMFEQIGRSLARESSPVLILLDDLHWADAGSLSLLEHLVQGQFDGRLLVVGAFRPAEFAARDTRLRALVGRHENGAELRLTGLSTAEVGALLLENRPDAEAVRARTHGNPLFVLEIARLGQLESLPDVIRDAIQQHLALLDPACLATLRVAAVMGSSVDVDALAEITGQDVPTVLTYVDKATAAGVLSSLEFQHDLFRETLRLDLSTSDRSAIHLRIADHLPASRVAEIARHRLAALPLGDAMLATTSAHTAGRAALANLAFEDAADLLDRALAVAPDDLPSTTRCALLIDASRAHLLQGDLDGAQQRCTEAAELARDTGDVENLARAVVALPEVSGPDWVPLVETWSQHALAGLPTEDSSLRAQVLAQHAMTLVYGNIHDNARMVAVSNEAYDMARRLDDRVATRISLRARQLAYSLPEGHTERLAIGAEMLELGRRTGDLDAVFWGHLWRSDALTQAGRVAEAVIELNRVDPVVARLGNPTARWHVLRNRIALSIAQGWFADAVRLLDEIKQVEPSAMHAVLWTGQAALLSRLTGDRFDLDHQISRRTSADHPVVMAGALMHAAPWYLAYGEIDKATAIYQRCPPPDQLPVPMVGLVAAMHGAIAAALGDKAAVAEDYQRLLPYAAQSHYELARALLKKGETAEAKQHARAASLAADQLGMRLLAAQVSALDSALDDNPLTPRQREVARLVAQGLTNRQLASALHISERTAESHVQNIMTTLGFQSRSQIATWSTQHQG